jgi:hypothetical protein
VPAPGGYRDEVVWEATGQRIHLKGPAEPFAPGAEVRAVSGWSYRSNYVDETEWLT